MQAAMTANMCGASEEYLGGMANARNGMGSRAFSMSFNGDEVAMELYHKRKPGTKYFSESGNLLFESNDGLSGAVTIVKASNQTAYNDGLKIAKALKIQNDQKFNQFLRKNAGYSYDLQSISDFYQNNHAKYPAKAIADINLAEYTDFKWANGSSFTPYSEVNANMVLRTDGILYVGQLTNHKGSNAQTCDNWDLPSELGKKAGIHLHPVSKDITFSYKQKGGIMQLFGQFHSGPSVSDQKAVIGSNSYWDVQVDEEHIYFYNKIQIIKIDR